MSLNSFRKISTLGLLAFVSLGVVSTAFGGALPSDQGHKPPPQAQPSKGVPPQKTLSPQLRRQQIQPSFRRLNSQNP